MNKLMKIALIGGGVLVLSSVCWDFGKIDVIRGIKDISPEGYDAIMENLSDMLKYYKLRPFDKARINFIFHQAIV